MKRARLVAAIARFLVTLLRVLERAARARDLRLELRDLRLELRRGLPEELLLLSAQRRHRRFVLFLHAPGAVLGLRELPFERHHDRAFAVDVFAKLRVFFLRCLNARLAVSNLALRLLEALLGLRELIGDERRGFFRLRCGLECLRGRLLRLA